MDPLEWVQQLNEELEKPITKEVKLAVNEKTFRRSGGTNVNKFNI